MSTRFSREELKRSYQGKEVPAHLREKVGDHFNDSFDSIEFKRKMAGELARRTELSRKRFYKKIGLTESERKRMEAYLPENDINNKTSNVKKRGGFLSSVFGNKKHHQQEEHVLTDKQKRRNIRESRLSSEEVNDSVGGVAGTGYQHTKMSFGGGDVDVAHRVSSLKTPEQIAGQGFAKKVEDPHRENKANAGFARNISEGIEGGKGSSPGSYPKRPIGF